MAGLSMLALTGMLFWLLTDASFRVRADHVTIIGLARAAEAQIRAHLPDVDRGPNAFRVRASELADDLESLPLVRSASAAVALPSDVRIRVIEREPLFVWTDGRAAWLVDETGLLFAGASDDPAPSATEDADDTDEPDDEGDPQASPGADLMLTAEAQGLPLVDDERIVSDPPASGMRLPAIDLAVMRQLLAVTPAMLGSQSRQLSLRIDDHDGYVLRSDDLAWRAILGHYTPTAQPPETVARQMQCLRWLLARGEPRLVETRLAISGNVCGTYTRQADSG